MHNMFNLGHTLRIINNKQQLYEYVQYLGAWVTIIAEGPRNQVQKKSITAVTLRCTLL